MGAQKYKYTKISQTKLDIEKFNLLVLVHHIEGTKSEFSLNSTLDCPSSINLVWTTGNLRVQSREKCFQRDRKALEFEIRIFKFWIKPS